MGKASVKVEDGKMVNVEVDNSSISVTGDFFIQPPEAREELENILQKIGEKDSKKDIIGMIQEVDAELIGFSAGDVAEAFMEARK